MPAAVAVPLALTGGSVASSLIGGKMASSAAKKAAEQQQQAAQEARQYLEPLYQQARAYAEPLYGQALQIAQEQNALGRAGLQPFASAGTQGMTALSSLLGLPQQAMASPSGAAPVNRAGMAPAGYLPSAQTMPRTGTLPTQAPTVMLRAPNGQTQAVPADHVDFYLARGAQRV